MSEQERQKKFENEEENTEDVDAHVKQGRSASEDEDGGDDVEAHVKNSRS